MVSRALSTWGGAAGGGESFSGQGKEKPVHWVAGDILVLGKEERALDRNTCTLECIVNRFALFSPTWPHCAESVIESPCPCVCVSVPSRNTPFRRSCRPLVEDRVHNIGLG